MVGYLAIVYALFVDIVIFGEHLSATELVGCSLVILITIFLSIYRLFQQQTTARQSCDESITSMNDLPECQEVTSNHHFYSVKRAWNRPLSPPSSQFRLNLHKITTSQELSC